MNVTLNIKRFNPDTDRPESYYESYHLEMDDSATILDGLIKIREEVDGSLTLRCSCRSSICGSCAMRINGQAKLACNTKIIDSVTEQNDPIVVEPVGNMQVVKDLVVDFKPFWDKIREIEPWLQHLGSKPQDEYIASNTSMLHLASVMDCIMCGACVSDCTVLQVDSSFLGPAALAKAYRFVADPRDTEQGSRLGALTEKGGVWDCTRCMQCVEVCPKDVDPMGRIMNIRDKAMEAGYTHSYGARHATTVTEDIENIGRVDELKLPIKTKGYFNIFEHLKLIPLGIKTQLKGKRPALFPKKNPGQENVRRLFTKGDKN